MVRGNRNKMQAPEQQVAEQNGRGVGTAGLHQQVGGNQEMQQRNPAQGRQLRSGSAAERRRARVMKPEKPRISMGKREAAER
jgi:hypothetical protein